MGNPQKQFMSESQYLALELQAKEKHEFIEGMIHAKAGAGERHDRIALNCAVALRSAARGTTCGVYVSDMKLRLSQGRAYYYPDVMMSWELAGPDGLFKEAPCFIAEVLSPSTVGTDTREKLFAYRSISSLRYYLVIDSEWVGVNCYTRSSDSEWFISALDPGESLEIVCGEVQAALGLADIYEDSGLV